MTTEKKPISKYAAKKIKNAKAIETSIVSAPGDKLENTEANNLDSSKKKEYSKTSKTLLKNIPNDLLNTIRLVKNNAEIRRFTALGIIYYLLNNHSIEGKHNYVNFKWDKFAVISDGIAREYRYTEPFFTYALVASFSAFSTTAQDTINEFTKNNLGKELIEMLSPEEDITEDILSWLGF